MSLLIYFSCERELNDFALYVGSTSFVRSFFFFIGGVKGWVVRIHFLFVFFCSFELDGDALSLNSLGELA